MGTTRTCAREMRSQVDNYLKDHDTEDHGQRDKNWQTRRTRRTRMGEEDRGSGTARETKASGTSTRRPDTSKPAKKVPEIRPGLRGPGRPGAEGLGTGKPGDWEGKGNQGQWDHHQKARYIKTRLKSTRTTTRTTWTRKTRSKRIKNRQTRGWESKGNQGQWDHHQKTR